MPRNLSVSSLYAKDQATYIWVYGRLKETPNRHSSNNTSTFYVSLFFLSFFYHRALAALGFGDLCRFALKSGRFSSTKVRGPLLLCSENNRFVVTIVRRLSWCLATILRGNTIGDSAGDEDDIHTMSSEIGRAHV